MSEGFARFRDWTSSRPIWLQIIVLVLAAAVAVVVVVVSVLPALAVWLFRREGSPILNRAFPAILILFWGLAVLPAIGQLGQESGAPAAQQSFADLPQAEDPATTSTDAIESTSTASEAITTITTVPTPTTSEATTTTEASPTTQVPTTTQAPTTTTQAPTTTRAPTTTIATTSTTLGGQGYGCHPAYVECVPDHPVDVDCAGGSGNGPVYVKGPIHLRNVSVDPYGLDGNDNDGIGCE